MKVILMLFGKLYYYQSICFYDVGGAAEGSGSGPVASGSGVDGNCYPNQVRHRIVVQ